MQKKTLINEIDHGIIWNRILKEKSNYVIRMKQRHGVHLVTVRIKMGISWN